MGRTLNSIQVDNRNNLILFTIIVSSGLNKHNAVSSLHIFSCIFTVPCMHQCFGLSEVRAKNVIREGYCAGNSSNVPNLAKARHVFDLKLNLMFPPPQGIWLSVVGVVGKGGRSGRSKFQSLEKPT